MWVVGKVGGGRWAVGKVGNEGQCNESDAMRVSAAAAKDLRLQINWSAWFCPTPSSRPPYCERGLALGAT